MELNKGILKKIKELISEGYAVNSSFVHTGRTTSYDMTTGKCLGTKENVYDAYRVGDMSVSKEYFRLGAYVTYELIKGDFEDIYNYLESEYKKQEEKEAGREYSKFITDYLGI